MKEAIELKKKELEILEAMDKVDFRNLPKDTLCQVSDNISMLAEGKCVKCYFYHRASNGALCFYQDGADSKTQRGCTNYKYVVIESEPPIDFRDWISIHRYKGTNTLRFEMREFPENLPTDYLTILEEESI